MSNEQTVVAVDLHLHPRSKWSGWGRIQPAAAEAGEYIPLSQPHRLCAWQVYPPGLFVDVNIYD